MADPLDIVTLDEAESAVNLQSNSVRQAEKLEPFITAVSRRVDELCGPVVVRTVEDEWHDGYVGTIFLRQPPVVSITTISEYASTAPTALTADTIPDDFDDPLTFAQYGYHLDNGLVHRRSSGWPATFSGRVRVTYEAGRYETTADVDAKFKVAVGSILRRLWAREAGAWARGGDAFAAEPGLGFFQAVDPMVREFLGDELKPLVLAG